MMVGNKPGNSEVVGLPHLQSFAHVPSLTEKHRKENNTCDNNAVSQLCTQLDCLTASPNSSYQCLEIKEEKVRLQRNILLNHLYKLQITIWKRKSIDTLYATSKCFK